MDSAQQSQGQVLSHHDLLPSHSNEAAITGYRLLSTVHLASCLMSWNADLVSSDAVCMKFDGF